MPFANGFCLFKGDIGKIGKIGQPHPCTTARLIFLSVWRIWDKWSHGGGTWMIFFFGNPQVLQDELIYLKCLDPLGATEILIVRPNKRRFLIDIILLTKEGALFSMSCLGSCRLAIA